MCVVLSRALGPGGRGQACKVVSPGSALPHGACVCSGALLPPEVGGPWEALLRSRKEVGGV